MQPTFLSGQRVCLFFGQYNIQYLFGFWEKFLNYTAYPRQKGITDVLIISR